MATKKAARVRRGVTVQGDDDEPADFQPGYAAGATNFDSAAIAGTRPNVYGSTDVHLLTRSPVQRSDGMRWFRRKAAGGMGLEDRVRDIVNKRRYADATS